jgi:hypothetical protein
VLDFGGQDGLPYTFFVYTTFRIVASLIYVIVLLRLGLGTGLADTTRGVTRYGLRSRFGILGESTVAVDLIVSLGADAMCSGRLYRAAREKYLTVPSDRQVR